jgi:MATE family multidrug resistance protein
MIKRFWEIYSPHFRATILLSVPVIIGQLGQVLIGVVDSVMIGGLGYEYLSAATLANSLYFIIVVIGMGVSLAISPLVAEAQGASEEDKAGLYLRQGVWVSLGMSLLLGGITFGSSWLIFLMDQPPRDAALAFSYLQILSLSTIPMLFFLAYKSFADGLSLTKPAMFITFFGLIVNALMNWILIYGKLGFPRYELDGAGYATIIGRTAMMVAMIVYINRSKLFRRFSPAMRWREFDLYTIKKILAIGLPSGFQFFFEVGAFAGVAIMIGWLGAEYRSAHQIAISLASITFMFAFGLGTGATIRVGDALGKKQMGVARLAGFSGILLSVCSSLFFSLVFILGRYQFPKLFGIEDGLVLDVAARLLLIAALFQIFDGIQAVGISILRGIQDVQIPTLVAFAVYWLVCLPLAYFMGFTLKMGVDGMWYAFLIGLGLASVAHTVRFSMLTRSST